MPTALIDGITTRYEVVGSGVPLLMFSPGGFDATLAKWSTLGVYAKTRMLDHLSKEYRCIVFDRRESGLSGGRVERITWDHYVAQGKGLLDHLGIECAHIMGGCMGCSPAMAFGVAHPASTLSLVLYWPAGGARYRIKSHLRLAEHAAYAQQHGLAAVISLASQDGESFGADPRVGPWAPVLRHDRAFAEAYATQDVDDYLLIVMGLARILFDRDTASGAEPEDLLRIRAPALVVPGRDASHATSAARYVEECLPRSEYWDVPVDGQTEEAVSARLLEFLRRTTTPAPR